MKSIIFSTVMNAVLIFSLGLIIAVFPNNFAGLVCIIAGIIALIVSIAKFIYSYKHKTLISAIAEHLPYAFAALFLIFFNQTIPNLLPFIVACYLFIKGVLYLIISLSYKKLSISAFLLLFIPAVFNIIVSVILAVFSAQAATLIIRLCGIMLIINSINSIINKVVRDKNPKKQSKNHIEGDFTDTSK